MRESDLNLLKILEENKFYNIKNLKELMNSCNNLGQVLRRYRRQLLMKNNIVVDEINDYLKREDIEQLFLVPLSETSYEYIKEAMKINKWTMKELFKECKESQLNIFIVVGTKNKRAL